MADDVIISVALMAYHYGASIRGTQITCKAICGKQPCAATLVRWRRLFVGSVCKICSNTEKFQSVIMCRSTIIPDKLEMKCLRFRSTLVSSNLLEKLESFFLKTDEWKPYSAVGHPGRRARFDQQVWTKMYQHEYYRKNPEYAKKLLKHPENLYVRIKLRALSPEERLEHKRRRTREWARKKIREKHGGKVDEALSRRGRKGAEIKYKRTYEEIHY
jgi:hypothetical protein